MMSSREDALELIREFESGCREILISRGTSEHELANACLEFQWKFLRMLLEKKSALSCSNRSNGFNKTSSIA